jgi:hypothetical protein
MFSLKVSDDVWMPKFLENGEFGLELLPLFGSHFGVADLFSAEYLLEEN